MPDLVFGIGENKDKAREFSLPRANISTPRRAQMSASIFDPCEISQWFSSGAPGKTPA